MEVQLAVSGGCGEIWSVRPETQTRLFLVQERGCGKAAGGEGEGARLCGDEAGGCNIATEESTEDGAEGRHFGACWV